MRIFISLLVLLLSQNLVAKEVKKIIALSPHAVEMLYAIGVGDRIVGTVEYADYPAEALKIPRIGSYAGVQIERIVEMQPDLIVAWKSGNKIADLKKLESLGFDMFYTHPKSVAEIGQDIISLGEKTGKEKEARMIADKIAIKHRSLVKANAKKDPVRVFYQLWHDPLRSVGPKSWVDLLIRDCNGKNIFDDASAAYPVVSLESVLAKNPQAIIFASHSHKEGGKNEFWDKWRSIDAVANNSLYTIDSDLLLRYTPRVVDGLEQLCEVIDKVRVKAQK